MTLTIFNTEVRQISVNAIPYSLRLCSRTNEVFNLSFTVNESPMSLAIDCYDFHGSKSSSFILTDAGKVRLRFTNFSKIIFTDASNSYPIYVSLQSILAQTENEFAELLLQQEFTIEDLTANNLAKQEQLPSSLTSSGNLSISLSENDIGTLPISIEANAIGNLPIEIAANSLGNVDINLAANTLGNLPIEIAANSLTSLPIEIVANSLTSLPIEIVSLGSTLGNIPIEIAANNIGNIPIEIAANTLGNIDINLAANTLGNLPIEIAAMSLTSLPIEIAANTLGNLTIDIAAQSIGNLSTDIGSYSQDLEENQSSGTNELIYNPYGYSTDSAPSLTAYTFNEFMFANVQQNGASGYLTFYLFCYNPTASAASATLTINLYNHLPEKSYNATPLNSFSFTTPSIPATSGVWVTIYPNIYWGYNSLIVIPQQQTGTAGNAIGIGQPTTVNGVNTHYWNSTYWDLGTGGITLYWSITNTAPSSMPVSVTNPITVHSGTPSNAISSSLIGTLATVPNGKKWKILRIMVQGKAIDTATAQLTAQIIPYNYNSGFNINIYENLTYINVSATAGIIYYGYGSIIGNVNLDYGNPIQSQNWATYPELYAGDSIYLFTNSNIGSLLTQIWYVESDI